MFIATVLSISDQAWARDASGNLRELSVGDALQEGETVITSNGGDVQLDFGDNLDPALIQDGEQVVMTPELNADQPVDASDFAALDEDLEALLSALDDESIDLLDVLDATAAGAGPGGGADGGHSFVRLARIVESVDPLAFNFGLNELGDPPEEQGAAFLLAETEVEEPASEQPGVIAPTAGSFEATLHDIETMSEAGSVASGVLPFTFGSGSSGGVSFAAMDGVTRQVGGETLTFSWNAGINTLQAASEARGVTIFSIQVAPSTGAFTVTQLNNLLHAEGMDEALAGLVYTVSSSSGSATGTLRLTIVDDAPQASNDNDGTVTEDSAVTVLSGSVLGNDTLGADDLGSLTWNVSDEDLAEIDRYGTLVLNDDGSWSFTLDNSLAAVQALNASDLLNFNLDYTVTDADGDTSSATLSLAIQGADDSAEVIVSAEGADSTVFEAGLTSVADTSETATGSFQVVATDGIASVTVGGQSFTLTQLQGFTAASPSVGIVTSMGTLYLTGYSGTASAGTVSYTYALGEAQMHGVPASNTDETLTDSVSLSMTGVGGSTASAKLTVDIIDDTPSLASLNLAIGNVAGTYDGVYEFDVGADAQGFLDSFGDGSLIWSGMPAGYELIITASSDTSITYTAQSGSFEFFNLTLHANGTYSFELVSPAPVVETEIESLLSSFDANNFFQEDGKEAYLFTSDLFDGKFAMAIKAYRNGKLEDVNMSATDLGVKSNVIQGNKNDMLRFDIRPVEDAGAIGIASFVFSVSGTGGTKAGDQAELTVYDVDGSSTIYTATLATANGEFLFDIDPSHNIDYLELRPAGNNSFKVDGISTSYVTQVYPDDYQLDFALSGSDADGDLANAAFTVFVKTTEDGTYEIAGTDGDDVVHGTEVDDNLIGGAGHDTLIGGDGDDIFQWNLGDQGGEGTAAVDTIKDFGVGGDMLGLADLLQSESPEAIDSFIVAAQQGSDTVLYINHEGGINVDGSNATQVIVLENVSMGEFSSAEFLQAMLESGQLQIDP